MLTTTFFTVIDHNIVFQVVQSTLGFHVINTISPHPASEYNIILKRTRSGVEVLDFLVTTYCVSHLLPLASSDAVILTVLTEDLYFS